MKKLNLASFLIGIGCTLIVITIFAFTTKSGSEPNTGQLFSSVLSVGNLTSSTAVQYRNNFKAIYPGAIEGINISVEQLEALNQTVNSLNNDLREVSGFRLYFGATANASAAPVVSIAYVVNKQYKQVESSANLFMAEGFSSKYRQQCPPFCD